MNLGEFPSWYRRLRREYFQFLALMYRRLEKRRGKKMSKNLRFHLVLNADLELWFKYLDDSATKIPGVLYESQ